VTVECLTADAAYVQAGIIFINEVDWAWSVWGLKYNSIDKGMFVCLHVQAPHIIHHYLFTYLFTYLFI